MFNSRLSLLRASLLGSSDAHLPVEWVVTPRTDRQYADALARDRGARRARLHQGDAPERIWLIEHPPLYTAGTSAKDERPYRPALSGPSRGRGGQFTYHGPGQPGRLCHARPQAPPAGRSRLCSVARSLADRDAEGVRRRRQRPARPVSAYGSSLPDKPRGAVGRNGRGQCLQRSGVRVKRWATLHGVALNVDPNLGAFFRHRRPAGFGRAHVPASPVSPTLAAPRPWARRTRRCAGRSCRCSARQPSGLASEYGQLPSQVAETIGAAMGLPHQASGKPAGRSGARLYARQ